MLPAVLCDEVRTETGGVWGSWAPQGGGGDTRAQGDILGAETKPRTNLTLTRFPSAFLLSLSLPHARRPEPPAPPKHLTSATGKGRWGASQGAPASGVSTAGLSSLWAPVACGRCHPPLTPWLPGSLRPASWPGVESGSWARGVGTCVPLLAHRRNGVRYGVRGSRCRGGGLSRPLALPSGLCALPGPTPEC